MTSVNIIPLPAASCSSFSFILFRGTTAELDIVGFGLFFFHLYFLYWVCGDTSFVRDVGRENIDPQKIEQLKNYSLRQIISFLLSAVLLLLGGCDIGQDNKDPAVKSQELRTKAVEYMNGHDYLHAEQLLSETLPLDQQLQHWDRLAEDQSTAAKVEASLGFFSSAIENNTEAWKYYRQVGDHAAEVRSMNAVGNLFIGLGDFEKGINILNDALDVSKLSSNNEPDPETSMNLGNAFFWSGQYENALDRFASALAIFNKRRYSPAIVRALSRVGSTYAKLGRKEEALGAYATIENIVSSVPNVIVKGEFNYNRGRTFESLGEWSAAAQSFHDGVDILESLSRLEKNEQTNDLLILLYTGLGKVYAHNFAYQLAKQSFIEGYSLAKDAGKKIAIGYLLIAIADCERKIGAVSPDQQASIAAGTYYEQAMTLFSRTGNVSGEAYANYKLGAMKEEGGNTDGALTFYKRAFELCSNQAGEFNNWGEDEEFFGIREGAIAEGIPFTQETFWYEPLVVALARQGRAEEALEIYEQGKAKYFSAKLRSFPYEFRDKNAGQAVESMQQQMRSAGVKEAELAFQKGLNANQRDAVRLAALTGEVTSANNALFSAASALSQKYPQLEILLHTPTFQETELRSALSYGTVVLDYLIADDRIVIFVISFDGMGRQMPVNVVEVPAYKDIVLEKIRQYDFMLNEHIHSIGTGYFQTTDIERLSAELYNYFLRPVERLFVQRVVIVPPREMEGIPFHAFTRSTNEGVKPMVEIADVSYLPYLAAVKSLQSPLRFTNTVIAVGNPRGNNWPLDFELRDIRSFFREATVYVSQNANEKQLFESFGDVLQLSTDFATDTLFPGQSTFVLSSGSITNPDANIPIADFLRLHPYPVVYLSGQQSDASSLTPIHAALLMMNGSSNIILTMRPSESKANKFFSEKFYSALAKGSNVNDAYRSAVVAMAKSPTFNAPYQWSQFFKFGK
jgi:tetratricopeptide (TPR) repeat protein